MLQSPAEEAAWANIVVTLGMIGDDRAVEPMIAFIEAGGQATLSRPQYAAKTSAVMSLGFIVNKTGNRRALDYLKAGLAPDAWGAKLAPAIASFHAARAERDRDFSKYAILGLALTGKPEAADALRELRRPAAGTAPSAFAVQVDDLVSEALNDHAAIAAKGLE